MSFLKKNLLFCIVVAICLVVFVGGAYLAFSASTGVEKSKRSLNDAQSRLASLLNSDPALTDDNVAAAEQNVSELSEALAGIREDLQRGAALTTSTDGVSVIAGIQQYIARFQKSAANHTRESGDKLPISIPKDFAFGFKEYLKVATPPDDPAIASQLDKQRQILSYMISRLMAADPQSISSVEREIIESDEKKNTFSIDESISARVPGAIDTMAFRLTFSGYTDTLRDFLNTLARFEMPIVVRSIEVKRPSGKETVVAAPRRNADNVFDLFGGGNTGTSKEEKPDGPKPVIEDNISQFTVTLEFIEVVLPDTQNEEVTDPA